VKSSKRIAKRRTTSWFELQITTSIQTIITYLSLVGPSRPVYVLIWIHFPTAFGYMLHPSIHPWSYPLSYHPSIMLFISPSYFLYTALYPVWRTADDRLCALFLDPSSREHPCIAAFVSVTNLSLEGECGLQRFRPAFYAYT
jgi:hypothetical protein